MTAFPPDFIEQNNEDTEARHAPTMEPDVYRVDAKSQCVFCAIESDDPRALQACVSTKNQTPWHRFETDKLDARYLCAGCATNYEITTRISEALRADYDLTLCEECGKEF